MSNHYNKKFKAADYYVGDRVSVKIPKIDRSSTDHSRIPGVIIKVNGHKVISYQIGTEYGILNDCYRAAGDLQHYSGSVEVNHDKNLSLRQAAALCNSCNKFTRGTCNCKFDCVSNRGSCKKMVYPAPPIDIKVDHVRIKMIIKINK